MDPGGGVRKKPGKIDEKNPPPLRGRSRVFVEGGGV